jgi:hypothetical protein
VIADAAALRTGSMAAFASSFGITHSASEKRFAIDPQIQTLYVRHASEGQPNREA